MVRVHFSLALADFNAVPFAGRRVVDLPDWAGLDINAESAARVICETFFEPGTGAWERFIGAEKESVALLIAIRRPKAIAGLYRVALGRTITAWVRKLPAA